MRHYSILDLDLFLAVSDCRSISRGAERMHLSAPSASLRMQKLEDALGVPLLERRSRGVELTAAGGVVAAHAKRLLAGLDDMEAELEPFARQARGTIRIVANYGASIDFLPADIGEFLAGNPDATVLLEQRSSPEVVELIASGRADIGVSAWEGPHPGVKFLPYRNDELVLVAPKDHPLAAAGEISFAEAAGCTFLALDRNSAMQRFMYDRAREENFSITPRVEVDNQQILLSLVNQGIGVAVTSRKALSASSAQNVACVRLTNPWAQRHLRIAVREKAEGISRAVKQFAEFLAQRAKRPA